VVLLVVCEKIIPAVVDDLPEGRSTWAAGLVDGWHSMCSYEHMLCGSSLECEAHVDSGFIGLISPMQPIVFCGSLPGLCT
jgi:hypothetical protein